MRRTDVKDWKLDGGPLWTYEMAPDTIARSRTAPTSAIPPSSVQRAHLMCAAARRARGERSIRWRAVAVDLPGPPDHPELARSLTAFVRRHDTLRSGFREPGQRRFLLAPQDINLAAIDQEESLSPGEAAGRLGEIFDAGTDPLTWPPYRFATAGNTLVMAFDHIDMDLVSLAVAAGEMLGTDDLPPPSSYLEHCRREEVGLRDQPERTRAVGRLWTETALSPGHALPSFPADLGVRPGDRVPLRYREAALLDAEATEHLQTHCLRAGAPLLAGLLAAAALTARRTTGAPGYRTILATQTRPPGQGRAFGWYVNALPIHIPGDTFPDALSAAAEALRRAHSARRIPYEEAWRTIEPPPTGGGSWFSYADLRDISPTSAQMIVNSTSGDDGDTWIDRTSNGLTLWMRHPDTVVANRTAPDWISTYREFLTTLSGVWDQR
jgi:hypothetical protein